VTARWEELARAAKRDECLGEDERMNEVREVDVEEIMRRIRENIHRRSGPAGAPPRGKSAAPFDDGQVAVDLECLHSGYDIEHVPFSSHRRIVGPLVVAIKKALRKLLKPLVDRQVAYNAANMRVTMHIAEWIEALDDQYVLASSQIEALERGHAELQELMSRTQLDVQEIESNFLNRARLELRQEILAAQSQALQEMGAALRTEVLAAQSQAFQEMRTEPRAETPAVQS
jgi:hypothetical protein